MHQVIYTMVLSMRLSLNCYEINYFYIVVSKHYMRNLCTVWDTICIGDKPQVHIPYVQYNVNNILPEPGNLNSKHCSLRTHSQFVRFFLCGGLQM